MSGNDSAHRHPSARLIVVPYRRARLHLTLFDRVPSRPSAHAFERMDLHCVVVARCGDLPHGVECRMADAQPALVLPHAHRRPCLALALNFPQVPDPQIAVERRGREEMWVLWMDRKAPDFFLGELVKVGGGRRGGASVMAADEAVEGGEVKDVGRHGVDFDTGEGLVSFGVGGAVDFGGGGLAEVEEAEGGVVGRGV